MIDPSKIDNRIVTARMRDAASTSKLITEIARLPVVARSYENISNFSLDILATQLRPGRCMDTGLGFGDLLNPPDSASYAFQLYSAICSVVDARAELKMLELIASPDFYAALMRSAAEVTPSAG